MKLSNIFLKIICYSSNLFLSQSSNQQLDLISNIASRIDDLILFQIKNKYIISTYTFNRKFILFQINFKIL